MACRARKTEHTGAYWGRKWEAKKESSKIRRRNWKRELATADDSTISVKK